MITKINAYQLGLNKKKDFLLFIIAFALFLMCGFAFNFYYCGWDYADGYVTTLLAFSYFKNGFLRRGLLGTIFSIICKIIPAAKSSYGVIGFMWGMNAVYFSSLLLFVHWILNKINDKNVYKGAYCFSMICFAFLIPTACYAYGAFGRADLIQIAICLLQIYLLVEKKCEWLTLPLTAVNVLFHEGYLLMTFGAVLTVLFYRAFCSGEQQTKYRLLLFLNIGICGVITILSLKCGNSAGTSESFEASSELAKLLNKNGSVHYNLLYMMSNYQPENAPVINDGNFVAQGLKELPVFLICFIPAFIVFGRGIFNILRFSKGKKTVLHIIAVLLGPSLIAVEYIKYCDYGRYIVWIVFYFLIMLLSFSVMGDKEAEKSLSISYGYKNTTALLTVALMMIYQPLPTCNFTQISSKILELL